MFSKNEEVEALVELCYQRQSKFGFHIGKRKTIFESFEVMKDTPLQAYQIYISNGRAWEVPYPNVDDIRKSRCWLCERGKYCCVHACLLYNMAGLADGPEPDPIKYNRVLATVRNSLKIELDTAAGFGGGVVVHIGAEKDKQRGIKTIQRTIEKVLCESVGSKEKGTIPLARGLDIPLDEFISSRRIILENAAGEGRKIGSDLDEISQIIKGVREDLHPQIKVCIDTAHIFEAGEYDFGDRRNVKKFFKDFDEKIGLEFLETIHLNDSRTKKKSKKDRHENLGLGYIFGYLREDDIDGLDGLKYLAETCMSKGIAMIGEPPAKTADKKPAPGGIWDYAVMNKICGLETSSFVCAD